MTEDDSGVLASVQEVVGFAWSLIELLFTRVLPLLGFLVAHLSLEAGRLALQILSPSSSQSSSTQRRRRHPKPSWLIQEEQRPPPWQSYAADLPSPPGRAPQWADSVNSLNHSEPSTPQNYAAAFVEAPQRTQPAASPEAAIAAAEHEPAEQVKPPSVSEKAEQGDSAAEQGASQHEQTLLQPPSSQTSVASPSKAHQQQNVTAPAGAGLSQTVHSAPSDRKAIDGSSQKMEKADSQPSDLNDDAAERRIEADPDAAEPMAVTGGNMERKSLSQSKRHPFSKVLPPSLSQIKRTLMHRSSRISPSKTPSPPLIKSRKSSRSSPRFSLF